jgi:hypothetical protein
MAVDQDQFVHLARPLAPTLLGFSAGNAPLTVNIQPQVCPPTHHLPPFSPSPPQCYSPTTPRLSYALTLVGKKRKKKGIDHAITL